MNSVNLDPSKQGDSVIQKSSFDTKKDSYINVFANLWTKDLGSAMQVCKDWQDYGKSMLTLRQRKIKGLENFFWKMEFPSSRIPLSGMRVSLSGFVGEKAYRYLQSLNIPETIIKKYIRFGYFATNSTRNINIETLSKSLNEAGPVAVERATLELPYLYDLLESTPDENISDKNNLYKKIASILKELNLLQEANDIIGKIKDDKSN